MKAYSNGFVHAHQKLLTGNVNGFAACCSIPSPKADDESSIVHSTKQGIARLLSHLYLGVIPLLPAHVVDQDDRQGVAHEVDGGATSVQKPIHCQNDRQIRREPL